jgi:hypothetical protein
MNAWRWMTVAGAAVLALCLAGLTRAAAQSQTDPFGRGRLVRVGEQPADEAEGFDAERWRAELGVADLERREASYARLIEIARRSPAARAALDEWAAEDGELAWTARMARRELGRGTAFGWLGHAAPGRRGMGLFGERELQERLRAIEDMLNDVPAPGAVGSVHERQSYSIEVGPDGARVKVQEETDGEEQTREYEGGSLDEILRANPELKDTIQLRPLDFDGQTLFGRLFDRDPGDGRPLQLFGPGEPPTHVLGIELDTPTAEQAAELGLEPGLGLWVRRTVPGTIAHILGLKRGDVVVELNQIPIYSGGDISRVLEERLPEAPVAVTIVDSKGKRRTLTWRPSQAPR